MIFVHAQFISGCMVGIEYIETVKDDTRSHGLVIDLFIIRVMFQKVNNVR